MLLHCGGSYENIVHHTYSTCNALEHFIHDALENFWCTFQSKWESQPSVPANRNLIARHKRVHGDAPFPRVTQRQPGAPPPPVGGYGSSVSHAHSSRGRQHAPQSHASWRKTYSLRNKNAPAPVRTLAGVSAPPGCRAGVRTAAAVSPPPKRDGRLIIAAATEAAFSSESKTSSSKPPPSDKVDTGTGSQSKPPPTTDAKPRNVTTQMGGNPPSLSSASNPPPHDPPARTFMRKSKFTWVKNQNEGAAPPSGRTGAPTYTSKPAAASRSSPSPTVGKRTPSRKVPRKLSPAAVALKTSKYKWVSSSADAHPKMPRKSPSPKSPMLPPRAPEKGEGAKRVRTAPSPSTKTKKTSFSGSSRGSRYHWKAGGQSSSADGGPAGGRRRSAFHWTSERSGKGTKGGAAGAPSATPMPPPSPGAFKLRSRMKIIRRSAGSGGGSNPSALKSSPRTRTHTWTRSPSGARRTPSRELVSFGRHKLRRLSLSYARSTLIPPYSPAVIPQYSPALIPPCAPMLLAALRFHGPPPHARGPPPSQSWRRGGGSSVCWIRGSLYRVSANKLSRTATPSTSINRTGRPFGSAHVPPLSSAHNRSSSRHLASRAVQRSLAIIRHARHRKSPKQFCMYYNRFGRCNRGNACPYVHDPDKVAVCTRFLRGTCKQADGGCPFSHKVSKEKMPVCSYFLKGICNHSDCPYSHVYVSRKADVCDDFVNGYCPEGEKCKKKHTLVCPDFSKTGSCPRGGRCKLQHRQRLKRGGGAAASATARRPHPKETGKRSADAPTVTPPRLSDRFLPVCRSSLLPPPSRPHLSVVVPATPAQQEEGPLALPSFISLSSSPEEADAPDTPLEETSQVKGKKLQIKPRL
ncbi:zinc finger CCCH domain-containing protein 3 [Antennarius striatus]|uniref:zinc finger CCCH domain-containing protein 3 n=1 Tax=Antennarius striatus TaxID=241820 RepID=UPI0035ADA93F